MLDTVTTPRSALRAAIAKRDAAAEAELSATKSMVRAKQLLDNAEQTLAVLAGVDEEINAHHAGAIKTWAANGGERPAGDLPPHLASKKAMKSEAETRVTAARAAAELLNKELVSACGRLRDREEGVQRAAGAVLIAEGEVIAEQLRQARRVVWTLTDKLSSLLTIRYKTADDKLVLIGEPADAFVALNEMAPAGTALNKTTDYTTERNRWERWLKALTENSEASLDTDDGSSVGSTPDLRCVRGAASR
jgi:hypothetical protein